MSDFIKCECGLYRLEDHPIPICPACKKTEYDIAFAEMRKFTEKSHLLGFDEYRDSFHIYVAGHVVCIDGMLLRRTTYQNSDKLIRRITDLETENKDVLAENARLRRRLEGKPSPSGSEGP